MASVAGVARPLPSTAARPLPRRGVAGCPSVARHARCAPRRETRVQARDIDADATDDTRVLGRRASLVAGAALLASTSASSGAVEAAEPPRITHRVFLDIGTCPSIVRADRALGGAGGLCAEPTSLGRVEIGLYGDLVPNAVSHFLELVEAPPGRGYKGTVFHRVKPGRYVLAGQAGSARMGQVQAPRFPPNPELLAAASFEQKHLRPGTVSLALAAATGDGEVGSMSRNSAQTEFLITTGPAPVPSLDGQNVVLGRVTRGLEVVAKIAATPTFAPSGNSVAWNQVAEWVGDDRAAKARESWSKPTMAVAITDAGMLSDQE